LSEGESAPNDVVSSAQGRRASGQAEERRRGQRLFGAVLGTLSQSSASASQKRRADIEKKQQAKLKLRDEELQEQKRRQAEEVLRRRRKDQRKYDEQSVGLLPRLFKYASETRQLI